MSPADRLKHVQSLMQVELGLCLQLYKEKTPPYLFEAISYALLSPGKRLRAYLAFEVAKIFSIPQKHMLPIALSIESMHCYSLIHDDLPCMDNADLRRGQPTVHKKFGEATALLAGNALLVVSFDILNKAQVFNFEQRNELLLMLIKSSGMHGMIGGQMLDILGERQSYDLDQIRHMQSLKTGCLIKFSIIAPLIHLNLAQADLTALNSFANDLGLAYQIADDIANIELPLKDIDKPVGSDTAQNKSTFVSLLGKQDAHDELILLIKRMENHLQDFGGKAAGLLWVAQSLINR